MSTSTPDREERIAEELIVTLALKRDADEPGAPAIRVAFLNRVCELGQLVYRRDAWPIAELGASVLSDGRWLVRVESLSIDRDTKRGGRSRSLHPSPDAGDVRSRNVPGFPLRLSLTMAVQLGLAEHFTHEVGESLYYQGERLVDPHADGEDGT
jgi:hypothetical protein